MKGNDMEHTHNRGGSFVIDGDGSRQLVEHTKNASEAEYDANQAPQTAQSPDPEADQALEPEISTFDEAAQIKKHRSK